MISPPKLFDRDLLSVRLSRKHTNAWFLHDFAQEHIHQRLIEVNKSFNRVAIIGFRAEIWSKFLGIEADCVFCDDDLSLQSNHYDLIIHVLELHRMDDPLGQLVQMRRALVPDGLMISVLFGGQTLHELRTAFAEAESQLRGGISPRVYPMGEIRDLGALIQRAGFAMPVADNIALNVRYESPLHLMRELRAMGETNIMLNRDKRFLSRRVLQQLITCYEQHFKMDGRIEATFDMIFLTGWAPCQTQQQPLKPGSAQMHLADALTVQLNSSKKIKKD